MAMNYQQLGRAIRHRDSDYFDMVEVEPILSKKEKAKKEKDLKEKTRKRLSHEHNRWVKFKDFLGKDYILPSNVFVISDFSFNLMKGSKEDFLDNIDVDAKKWLKNKAVEYKKYSETGRRPSGAFWDNIFNTHKEADLEVLRYGKIDDSLTQNLDKKSTRKIFRSRIEKIRNDTIKEKYEVNNWDNGSIDDLLDGLGGYDEPRKEKKPSNDEILASRFGEATAHAHAHDGTTAVNSCGTYTTIADSKLTAGAVEIHGDLKVNGEMLVWDESINDWKTVNIKGNKMRIENVKNTIVSEVKELANASGAADIAFGRILYNNIKSALGKTVVKISFVDRAVAKVSKKMKYKNEVTELIGVLTALVILKQFYDHKALENVRGYAVNRLYTIGIEATGMDDVLALITQAEKVSVNEG